MTERNKMIASKIVSQVTGRTGPESRRNRFSHSLGEGEGGGGIDPGPARMQRADFRRRACASTTCTIYISRDKAVPSRGGRGAGAPGRVLVGAG